MIEERTSQTHRLLLSSNSSSQSGVTIDTLKPIEVMDKIDEHRTCRKEGNDEKGSFFVSLLPLLMTTNGDGMDLTLKKRSSVEITRHAKLKSS